MMPGYSIRSRSCIAVLLILAVVLVACSQHALETVAEIDAKYSKGLTDLQAVARKAHETPKVGAGAGPGVMVLSDANYKTWLDIAEKLNLAGVEFNKYLKGQAKLAPAERSRASSQVSVLAKLVQDAIAVDLIKIDSADLRSQMQVALESVQAALNSASIALAAGGN